MPDAAMSPMLAVAGELPHGDGWAFEYKWDGVRTLAHIDGERVRLYTRNGNEITVAFPELSGLASEGIPDAVFDGELVGFDSSGHPDFGAVAERLQVRSADRARRLARSGPVRYLVFDVLRWDGVDTRRLPYDDRRRLLDQIALSGPNWEITPSMSDGDAIWRAARDNGLEGVMAKRRAAPYRSGHRSRDWLKIKVVRTVDLVVGGWRSSDKRRLSALLVGEPSGAGRLSFRGRVGGGFTAAREREVLERLAPLSTGASPFDTELSVEDRRRASWVLPRLVVEVAYGQLTAERRLRFPRFVRLRPDKEPDEVVREG